VARDISIMSTRTIENKFQFGLKFEFTGKEVHFMNAFIVPWNQVESPDKKFKNREKFQKPDFMLPYLGDPNDTKIPYSPIQIDNCYLKANDFLDLIFDKKKVISEYESIQKIQNSHVSNKSTTKYKSSDRKSVATHNLLFNKTNDNYMFKIYEKKDKLIVNEKKIDDECG